MPQILFAAVLLGMFRWTNYWDFVIYFVVTGGVVLFTNIVLMKGQGKWVIGVTAAPVSYTHLQRSLQLSCALV